MRIQLSLCYAESACCSQSSWLLGLSLPLSGFELLCLHRLDGFFLLQSLFVVVQIYVAVLAEALRVKFFVWAPGRFFLPPKFMVTIGAHAFCIVFSVGVATAVDSLDLLFHQHR